METPAPMTTGQRRIDWARMTALAMARATRDQSPEHVIERAKVYEAYLLGEGTAAAS